MGQGECAGPSNPNCKPFTMMLQVIGRYFAGGCKGTPKAFKASVSPPRTLNTKFAQRVGKFCHGAAMCRESCPWARRPICASVSASRFFDQESTRETDENDNILSGLSPHGSKWRGDRNGSMTWNALFTRSCYYASLEHIEQKQNHFHFSRTPKTP